MYRRFVPSSTDIATLLTKFLRKVQPKILQTLNDQEIHAFDKLFQTMSSKPVLDLPCPDLRFVIETDAKDYQVGAALFQAYSDGECYPIGF